MRVLAPTLLLLTLAACGTPTTDSYSLGRGTLSYDDLRRHSEECRARGGVIQPIGEGGDPSELANYTCVISKDK